MPTEPTHLPRGTHGAWRACTKAQVFSADPYLLESSEKSLFICPTKAY